MAERREAGGQVGAAPGAPDQTALARSPRPRARCQREEECTMSEFLVGRALVLLGEGCESDPSVLLGDRTGRPIADPHLRVGARARLRSGTVLYAGTTIGDDFQTGHNGVV